MDIKNSLKLGITLLVSGIVGALLIVIVSLSLYGKIYFFNGYAFTKLLWIVCFILFFLGLCFVAYALPKLSSNSVTHTPFMILSIALFLIAMIISIATGNTLIFVISEIICIGVGLFVAWTNEWMHTSKIIFIAIIIGVVLALMVSALGGGKSECKYCGGRGYFGGGSYGQMVDCPDC